ncbi:MAG TPA: hypothetical protein VID67_10615 [Rhizomicrobium sp.]|jgi:hypothetical protein
MRSRLVLTALTVAAALLARAPVYAAGASFNAQSAAKIAYSPDVEFSAPSSPWTAYAPFAVSGVSPFGPFTASGYTTNGEAPLFLSGGTQAVDRNRHDVRDLQLTAALSDSFTLNIAHNLDLQGRFDAFGPQSGGAFDGLFLNSSAVGIPYSAFGGSSDFVGATVALASDLHVNFGEATFGSQRNSFDAPVFSYLAQGLQNSLDRRTGRSAMAGVNWNFAPWGGVGLSASSTAQRNLFPGLNTNALAMSDGSTTNAMGLSAHIAFGAGWVTTVSYSEGISQLDLRASSVASGSDSQHSRGYGIAVAKHGLFANNDSLGLAVSRPIPFNSGGLGLTGLDDLNNILTDNEHISLASRSPETDFEMGYVTTFFDGALALQANAAWQQNLAGQSGVNSLAVLSRAKINF